MSKSQHAEAVDDIQRKLRPFLQQLAFKVRGRTFNRRTEDGLTQVVSVQMGRSDPPGARHVPGLREDLHGLFTVNLGTYVPEVARHYGASEASSWVQEYHCCVRARLGELIGGQDYWWHARANDEVIAEVQRCIETAGLPFLERFASRDRILAELNGRSENQGVGSPPRIVSAIILLERGEQHRARALLLQQALETTTLGHAAYVRSLAEALGLGQLD